MCFNLHWNTQDKESNKATSKQLSQMNLQYHKRAAKTHFPFPLLIVVFPFLTSAGLEWEPTGHWPFLVDSINLTPQWMNTSPDCWWTCYCTSVWILSRMRSTLVIFGNISSFFNAMKTFSSTCFVFLYCSLAKHSWQHGNSLLLILSLDNSWWTSWSWSLWLQLKLTKAI